MHKWRKTVTFALDEMNRKQKSQNIKDYDKRGIRLSGEMMTRNQIAIFAVFSHSSAFRHFKCTDEMENIEHMLLSFQKIFFDGGIFNDFLRFNEVIL